jgi:hypothetical protein
MKASNLLTARLFQPRYTALPSYDAFARMQVKSFQFAPRPYTLLSLIACKTLATDMAAAIHGRVIAASVTVSWVLARLLQ